MPEKSTGVKHVSTGDTDGSTPRALVIGVRKGGALGGEAIEIGSFDLIVS